MRRLPGVESRDAALQSFLLSPAFHWSCLGLTALHVRALELRFIQNGPATWPEGSRDLVEPAELRCDSE
jgi:hypothetical protein